MLGRLIKFDMKSDVKGILIIWAAAFVLAVISGISYNANQLAGNIVYVLSTLLSGKSVGAFAQNLSEGIDLHGTAVTAGDIVMCFVFMLSYIAAFILAIYTAILTVKDAYITDSGGFLCYNQIS